MRASIVRKCLRQYWDSGRQIPNTIGSWISTFPEILTALPEILTIVGRNQELAIRQIVASGEFKVVVTKLAEKRIKRPALTDRYNIKRALTGRRYYRR